MITPDRREILRYLGYRSGSLPDASVLESIERCKALLLKAATPRSVVRTCHLDLEESSGFVKIDNRLAITSRMLAKHLSGCTRAALFAATLGLDTDRLIAKAQVQNIADAAIRNAVLMDDSYLTNPTEMGKIVETAVYKHIVAFYYQMATSVGYYRGGKKNKEIDVVVDYPNVPNILIEVKYREAAPIADDDAIVELCEEASVGIVVTKTATDFGVHNTPCGKDLLRIPAFAFLYLLGNAEKHGYQGCAFGNQGRT